MGIEVYIIVTAAPDHLPQPIIAQLIDGGRLVIPIDPIGAVRFVPLTGEH